MKSSHIFLALLLIFILACSNQAKDEIQQKTDANGYTYQFVQDDPFGVRIYTLQNGLKVYLSQNADAPRIKTFIAVRAGSSFDPKETTGLAHYLEHMMFKGTDEIGTTDWEKEKQLLDQISDLFEAHKAEQDAEKKKVIYAKIDSVSQIAASYAIPNEYTKMVNSLGAKGTNAWTSNEETVYVNDIPSNALAKWLNLESERFGTLALRLFHTELETVYEEFNMGQDNDNRNAYYKLLENLFPTHPYGQQTTIGKAEHLKNPSMVNIHNYWNTYYVPNNMAICLSGDLEFDKTIKLIDQTFGSFKTGDVPKKELPKEEELTEIIEAEVMGPESEHLRMGFRVGGVHSEDRKYTQVINHLLTNNVAGMLQLNLVQKQKVLQASSYVRNLNEYGVHMFWGKPREGQKLEEVKDLILAEVEKIKAGNFDDWLVQAAIRDIKLQQTLELESNQRAYKFVRSFISGREWKQELDYINQLGSITKEELVKFAKDHYGNNYVVVYKRKGENKDAIKVEKPQITSVPLNRESASEFMGAFSEMEVESLEPQFVNFEEDIQKIQLAEEVELNYIKNTVPNLFTLYFMVDMGKDNLKELATSIDLLNYLGTNKYAPDELKKEFYKKGVRVYSRCRGKDAIFVLYGLEESFEPAVELLEHVLTSIKPDEEVFAEYIKGVEKKRADAKLNKSTILWQGLLNYAKYGPQNPFTNIVTNEELKNSKSEKYTKLVKQLSAYPHRFVYVGSQDQEAVKSIINKHHIVPEQRLEIPEGIEKNELEYEKPTVYFANYDMRQVRIVMVSKDVKFNPELLPEASLFNNYFGSGLSSIVFQEIREAKGLAYSAFSQYSRASDPEESNYVYAYLATQADKLEEASSAMLDLMNNMPNAENQFEAARESVLKKIETDRKVNTNLFWHYKSHLDVDMAKDMRSIVYDKAKNMTIADLEKFFNKHIANKNYTFLVVGNKTDLDLDKLKGLGELKELSLNQIFNY